MVITSADRAPGGLRPLRRHGPPAASPSGVPPSHRRGIPPIAWIVLGCLLAFPIVLFIMVLIVTTPRGSVPPGVLGPGSVVATVPAPARLATEVSPSPRSPPPGAMAGAVYQMPPASAPGPA